METLVLDGKEYVKASAAAKAAGYTSDYVGQLCRSGAVDAHLIGRSWYVNQDQLGKHRVEKKRMSRVKAREQVRKAVEEKKKELSETGYSKVGIRKVANFEKHSVSYESDDSDLLPQVKKLSVEVDENRQKRKRLARKLGQKKFKAKKEPNYVIENEGKKVKMSGKLDIFDATDETFAGSGTIVMTPRIVKGSKTKKQSSKKAINAPLPSQPEGDDIEEEPVKTDFLTKLAQLEEQSGVFSEEIEERQEEENTQNESLRGENSPEQEYAEDETEYSAEAQNEPIGVREEKVFSLFTILVVSVALITVIATAALQSNWSYKGGGSKIEPPAYGTALQFDFKNLSQ